MTWLEVERAARNGAVVLWGLGVIEEHGPHLPLGTDVYLPYATLKLTRRRLAERGVEALIAPPFYWGVNNVTGSFPGSFTVRPDTMRAPCSTCSQVQKYGFETVFCVSGQGDALHNQTMAEAIRRPRRDRRAGLLRAGQRVGRAAALRGGRRAVLDLSAQSAADTGMPTCTRAPVRPRWPGASSPTWCTPTWCARCGQPTSASTISPSGDAAGPTRGARRRWATWAIRRRAIPSGAACCSRPRPIWWPRRSSPSWRSGSP